MLKIKSNIDLKELEKFGFEYYENGDYKVWQREKWDSYLGVEIKDRILQIGCVDYNNIEEDIIYDLIKADLVEKVGDK